VEKQALDAGADAHFRNPVDVPELRITLAETVRRRREEAERDRMRQQSIESTRFQDFVGSSEPMRRAYEAIQQVAGRSINVLIRGESGRSELSAAEARYQEAELRELDNIRDGLRMLGLMQCSCCRRYFKCPDGKNLFNAGQLVCYGCVRGWWEQRSPELTIAEREIIERQLLRWLATYVSG
jgi:hypothetical protein